MENKSLKIFGIVVVLLVVVFFAFGNKEGKKVSHNSDMHMMSDGTVMLNSDMKNMHESMKVSTDEEFIKGMIPHHEEAVFTAKEVLARGGSFEEIKSLARGLVRCILYGEQQLYPNDERFIKTFWCGARQSFLRRYDNASYGCGNDGITSFKLF